MAGALLAHDLDALARALDRPDAPLAHPTTEHFLPLLYVAGAASAADPVRFPVEGFDMGSLSMRSVLVG